MEGKQEFAKSLVAVVGHEEFIQADPLIVNKDRRHPCLALSIDVARKEFIHRTNCITKLSCKFYMKCRWKLLQQGQCMSELPWPVCD